ERARDTDLSERSVADPESLTDSEWAEFTAYEDRRGDNAFNELKARKDHGETLSESSQGALDYWQKERDDQVSGVKVPTQEEKVAKTKRDSVNEWQARKASDNSSGQQTEGAAPKTGTETP